MYLKIYSSSIISAAGVLLYFIYAGGDFSKEIWIVAGISYGIASLVVLIFFFLNRRLINEIASKNKLGKIIDLIFGIDKK
jgi:threonine/homoserine/homoserine lactone efflux protein